MRALMVGVPALLLALVLSANANNAPNSPWCVRNATSTSCGSASLDRCTEGGRCEQNAMHKPSADQPLIAQQESTPPPPEGSDRKQSAMPQATRQQKMKTCEFGAKDQKLTGAPRKTFMARCLASDDAPGGKAGAKPQQ